MKNYKDMTYRYLKGQKSRTFLTIFGIILSVALVTAIGTMMVSVRDALITETIRDVGAYHGIFSNLDEDTISKLKNHVDVDEVVIAKEEGSAPLVETTEEERENYGNQAP